MEIAIGLMELLPCEVTEKWRWVAKLLIAPYLQCLPPGDPRNPCVSDVKKGGPGKRQLIHSGEANSVSRSVISINDHRLSVININ